MAFAGGAHFLLCAICISQTVLADSDSKGIAFHEKYYLVNSNQCGLFHSDRIIGGKTAPMGANPWLARIGYSHVRKPELIQYRCGGSMINDKYILTASHCVAGLPPGYSVKSVRLGEYDDRTSPDCTMGGVCADAPQDFDVEIVYHHKHFVPKIFMNDVAVIRVKGKIVFTDWVRPICLPTAAFMAQNMTGRLMWVAGWGVYNITSFQPARVLQEVRVPVVEVARCQAAFPSYRVDGERQVCAGGIKDRDSCGGDSGGPLTVVSDADGPPRVYIYGLVSFGAKKCGSPEPAVYTSVFHYLEWILDHLYE